MTDAPNPTPAVPAPDPTAPAITTTTMTTTTATATTTAAAATASAAATAATAATASAAAAPDPAPTADPPPAPLRLARGRVPAASRERADQRLLERFAATRDSADRDALIERFLPLARQLAAGYQRPNEPFDDIYQVACYGLVKAVDRFDPARGRAFTSYAVPTIVGEIKRHFRDRTWAVRVPRDLQELSLRVDRAITDLTRTHGHQPTIPDIAHTLHADPEDVLEAIQAGHAYRATSLDAPRPSPNPQDTATLADTLGAPDPAYDQAENRALITTLLRSLPTRERLVIHMRFNDQCTQAQIGERIGVSQMQVSRIIRTTLARLHQIATDAES